MTPIENLMGAFIVIGVEAFYKNLALMQKTQESILACYGFNR